MKFLINIVWLERDDHKKSLDIREIVKAMLMLMIVNFILAPLGDTNLSFSTRSSVSVFPRTT